MKLNLLMVFGLKFGDPLNPMPFQDPSQDLLAEPFLIMNWGYPRGSHINVKSPRDGSSALFQDDKYGSSPVTLSIPNFMPGKSVLPG